MSILTNELSARAERVKHYFSACNSPGAGLQTPIKLRRIEEIEVHDVPFFILVNLNRIESTPAGSEEHLCAVERLEILKQKIKENAQQ